MKRLFLTIAATLLLAIVPGCGNLSPRQQQDIDNQNGKIGEIENMANSLKSEVGTLKSQAEITNSKLDRIQMGLVNNQSNNSGIQILSGPGGLIFAIVAVLGSTVLVLHYRKQAVINEKTASLLTERIVDQDNENLLNEVFSAAMYTDVEENVLTLVKKHQARFS